MLKPAEKLNKNHIIVAKLKNGSGFVLQKKNQLKYSLVHKEEGELLDSTLRKLFASHGK